jgi:hypothetical protein
LSPQFRSLSVRQPTTWLQFHKRNTEHSVVLGLTRLFGRTRAGHDEGDWKRPIAAAGRQRDRTLSAPGMGVENEPIQALFRSEDRHSLTRACIRQESIEIEIQSLATVREAERLCAPSSAMVRQRTIAAMRARTEPFDVFREAEDRLPG